MHNFAILFDSKNWAMKIKMVCLLLCSIYYTQMNGLADNGKKTLLLIHEVKCPKVQAYAYFIDFEKFGKIHPVIKETKRIKDPVGNSMGIYSIKEHIFLFGFIPLNPRYNAEVIEDEKGRRIVYTSQVKKNLYLEIVFSFSEENEKTKIREEVTVTGNTFICWMFRRQIKKMHLLLIENLKKEI